MSQEFILTTLKSLVTIACVTEEAHDIRVFDRVSFAVP